MCHGHRRDGASAHRDGSSRALAHDHDATAAAYLSAMAVGKFESPPTASSTAVVSSLSSCPGSAADRHGPLMTGQPLQYSTPTDLETSADCMIEIIISSESFHPHAAAILPSVARCIPSDGSQVKRDRDCNAAFPPPPASVAVAIHIVLSQSHHQTTCADDGPGNENSRIHLSQVAATLEEYDGRAQPSHSEGQYNQIFALESP